MKASRFLIMHLAKQAPYRNYAEQHGKGHPEYIKRAEADGRFCNFDHAYGVPRRVRPIGRIKAVGEVLAIILDGSLHECSVVQGPLLDTFPGE